MVISKETIFICLVMLIVTSLVGLLVWSEFKTQAKNIIDDCYEFGEVKYRYEGTGGLFGGVKKIYLDNDTINYDNKEIICVKGSNVFGDYVDKT